jgi:hypothetical protein
VFYIGTSSFAAFNVLDNDADYECTEHGYYTTKQYCDMYVLNFTQPMFGTVKFPDAPPPFPWDRAQVSDAGGPEQSGDDSFTTRYPVAAAAAAAAERVSEVVHSAASGGGGMIRDWKQHGLLQYALNSSIQRPVIDKVKRHEQRQTLVCRAFLTRKNSSRIKAWILLILAAVDAAPMHVFSCNYYVWPCCVVCFASDCCALFCVLLAVHVHSG